MSTLCRDAALAYARRGLCIIPCDGKVPLTDHGSLDATTDPAQIATWWDDSRDANVAMGTGERSGIDVFDVDADHDGLASLARLVAQQGALDPTWRARSGGGGLHVFFRHWPDMTNSVGRVGRGLDVRGDGGYLILPPSLHPSGRRYEWLNHPDDVPLAPWPTWLLGLALPRTLRPMEEPAAIPSGPWPVPPGLERFAAAGAAEGERNARAFWLACRLIQHCGNSREARATLDLFAQRCRPAMDKREVARVWNSAVGTPSFRPSMAATPQECGCRLPPLERPVGVPLPPLERPVGVPLPPLTRRVGVPLQEVI